MEIEQNSEIIWWIEVKYSLHSSLAFNSLHSPLAFVLCIHLKAISGGLMEVADEPCGGL